MSSSIDGDTIRQIREKRDQDQTEFGLEIYDTTPGTAQKLVSDLENENIRPGKAAIKTIRRMQRGEI
jgi:DNA-binding transcriptional regulator YiaG